MKRQPIEWEKIFTNDTSNTGWGKSRFTVVHTKNNTLINK